MSAKRKATIDTLLKQHGMDKQLIEMLMKYKGSDNVVAFLGSAKTAFNDAFYRIVELSITGKLQTEGKDFFMVLTEALEHTKKHSFKETPND